MSISLTLLAALFVLHSGAALLRFTATLSNGRLHFVFYSAAWVVLETALAQAKTSLAHSEFYNRVGTVFRRPLSRKVRAFLARGFGASATRLGQVVVGH